jgi:hypothetical protein
MGRAEEPMDNEDSLELLEERLMRDQVSVKAKKGKRKKKG